MNIVAMIASGLFSFFNRTIVTGLLGKAIFLALISWVILILLGGIVSLIQQFLQLPALTSLLGGFGAYGSMIFYMFTVFVQPGLAVAIASRVVVFIIRRLPVVG